MMRKFMMTSLLVFVRPGSAAQLAAGALVKMLKSLAMDIMILINVLSYSRMLGICC